MESSEKLIELGNSWYTAKTIEVERQKRHSEGTALEGNGEKWPSYQTKPGTSKILNWKYRTVHTIQKVGLRCRFGSQIICDKVVNQEGNSPDQELRYQMITK